MNNDEIKDAYKGMVIATHVYIEPCSIDELENKINEIEQRKNFTGWCAPIMEQLDKVLGMMTDPDNDKFPGCFVLYYEDSPINNNYLCYKTIYGRTR